MTDNIKDLLPFYALDALTDDERAQVEAWLAAHPEAQAELDDMQYATDHLADTVEPIVPSTQVKSALMDRVASDVRTVTPQKPAAQPLARRTAWDIWESVWGRWNRFTAQPVTRALLASITLSLISILLSTIIVLRSDIRQLRVEVAEKNFTIAEQNLLRTVNEVQVTQSAEALETANAELAAIQEKAASLEDELATLQLTNDALRQQLAEDAELLAIFRAPNLQTAPIVGTEFDQDAIGTLIINPDEQVAVLSVNNLDPIADSQTYQFWLIGDDGPESAGTFAIDPDGSATYTFPLASFESYAAIGVSIEPIGGSEQPTGNIVMLTPDV